MPSIPTQLAVETALVDLDLNAVALCNQGANTRADILLFKRKETKSMPQTFEELMKGLEPSAAELVTKHIGELQAADKEAIGKLTTRVTELEKAAAEKSAKKQPIQPTEKMEDVFKGASPEMMAEINKMRTALQQLQEAQANELTEKRYQLCKAIPVEEAKLRDVLKSVSPAAAEVLQAAAAVIEAGIMKEKGTSVDGQMHGQSADDAYAALEKSAKDIMSANAGMTFEKAFTEACNRDPQSYQKYVEGVR